MTAISHYLSPAASSQTPSLPTRVVILEGDATTPAGLTAAIESDPSLALVTVIAAARAVAAPLS